MNSLCLYRLPRRYLHQSFVNAITPPVANFHLRRKQRPDAPKIITAPNLSWLLFTTIQPSPHEDIVVHGFVRSVRKHPNVAFISLVDGSCIQTLQVVVGNQNIEGIANGAGLRVKGRWVKSGQARMQPYELQASEVTVLGESNAEKKTLTAEYLRTMPHLRVRTAENATYLRLRSLVINNTVKFFDSRDFIQTHPPVITSSDSEGAGQVFTVSAETSHNPAKHEAEEVEQNGQDQSVQPAHFFKTPKYLTVSSQLHLEALAASVGRVWALAPAFRAERSDTSRHLSEFYMLEAEMSFTESLEEVMTLLEDWLKRIVNRLVASRECKELVRNVRSMEDRQEAQVMEEYDRSNAGEENRPAITNQQLQLRWRNMLLDDWPRITYTEAIQGLQDAVNQEKVVFEHIPTWGSGLQAEHERYIAQEVGKGRPVFVTDFPRAIKPFYMAPSSSSLSTDENESPSSIPTTPGPTVACFDLLVPEMGEIAGGSLREHREEELIQSMREHGLLKPTESSPLSKLRALAGQDQSMLNQEQTMSSFDGTPNPLQWYIDLRKWGSVPHGGFGVGFDRLLAYLAGVPNVREMVTFPRHFQQCRC
ncbi:MAG: hypothetical protein M1823_003310 [Watsoniomyces obsoletus]|nr:MAG: hypothetical protein M1823_003310 [Watsoniomyces obsoletus]